MSWSYENFLGDIDSLVRADEVERSQTLELLRSAFIAERLKTNLELETVRKKAIQALENKLDTMNPSHVMRALQTLNEVAKDDFASVLGSIKSTINNNVGVKVNNILGVGIKTEGRSAAPVDGGRSTSTTEDIRFLSEALEVFDTVKDDILSKNQDLLGD